MRKQPILRGLILCFFCYIFPYTVAQAKKTTSDKNIILKDVAIWKIGTEIYFHSDIVHLLSELKRYQCLNPDNNLFLLLDLKYSDITKLQKLMGHTFKDLVPGEKFKNWPRLQHSPELIKKLNSLMLLLMLGDYTLSQKIIVNSHVLHLLEKAITVNHCVGGKVLGDIIEKLLRVEVFLRARFHRDSFWVSPEELASQKKNSEKKILEIDHKEKKAQEARRVFLESLPKQMNHEDY